MAGFAAYIGMPTKLVIILALSTVIAWAGSLNPTVLAELNDCIQHRFLNTGVFGMARILPLHGIRQFRPDNETERNVLDLLKQQHYDVALFLAGRQILPPSNASIGGIAFIDPRTTVQGPAYITPSAANAELLKPADLVEEARVALASFSSGEGYSIQKDGWTVMMRPLRATSQTCVQCHTIGTGGKNAQLKIGDALGVVMYVYRGPKVILESAVNLR